MAPTARAGVQMTKIAVLVSSSDNTRDVFDRVYARFDRLWPDCPWPRYVGLTRMPQEPTINGFRPVAAGEEAGWRHELRRQVAELPSDITHILLMLDDFLLYERVDTAAIENFCTAAMARGVPYARLQPVSRSLLVSAVRRIWAWASGREMHPLSSSEPYYSSLQSTLWRRDHLVACLTLPNSIWDFEHIVPLGGGHYASTQHLLRYRHVVERGKWLNDAAAIFRRAGLDFEPGQRSTHNTVYGLHWLKRRIRFALIGFTVVRLKRALGYGLGAHSSR